MASRTRTCRRAVRSAAVVVALVGLSACQRGGEGITVDGEPRDFLVAVGPGVSPDARAPVVFVWHGFGGSAANMLRELDPQRRWPEAIVVAPVGLERTLDGVASGAQPGWQVERGEHGDRDLALFDALLERLRAEHRIDLDRVYAVGFSNGGYFANLLGCVRGDVLAAVASVGGGGPRGERCFAATAVQIIHGTADGIVPYSEGRGSWDRWRDINDCGSRKAAAGANCFSASGCEAETLLCSFTGGHTWPGGATERIVEFLKQNRRR